MTQLSLPLPIHIARSKCRTRSAQTTSRSRKTCVLLVVRMAAGTVRLGRLELAGKRIPLTRTPTRARYRTELPSVTSQRRCPQELITAFTAESPLGPVSTAVLPHDEQFGIRDRRVVRAEHPPTIDIAGVATRDKVCRVIVAGVAVQMIDEEGLLVLTAGHPPQAHVAPVTSVPSRSDLVVEHQSMFTDLSASRVKRMARCLRRLIAATHDRHTTRYSSSRLTRRQ